MRRGWLMVALLMACADTDSDSGGDPLTSTRIQLDQQACYAEFERCYGEAEGLAQQDVCEFALEDCVAATGGRPPVQETPCDEQLQSCLDEGYDPAECEEEAAACREIQGA